MYVFWSLGPLKTKREGLGHKNLTSPLFIVQSQESKRSCIYLLEVSILSLFLRLSDWILELFWPCCTFCFSIYFSYIVTTRLNGAGKKGWRIVINWLVWPPPPMHVIIIMLNNWIALLSTYINIYIIID